MGPHARPWLAMYTAGGALPIQQQEGPMWQPPQCGKQCLEWCMQIQAFKVCCTTPNTLRKCGSDKTGHTSSTSGVIALHHVPSRSRCWYVQLLIQLGTCSEPMRVFWTPHEELFESQTHWLVTATVDSVGLQYVLQDIVLIRCYVEFILPLALVPQGCCSPSTTWCTCSLVLCALVRLVRQQVSS
jgi:hypothetical protein